METGKRSKSESAKIGAKQEIDFVVNQMTSTTNDTLAFPTPCRPRSKVVYDRFLLVVTSF